MSFCFECGDKLDDDLSSCNSCGWNQTQLEEEKYYPDQRCRDCERAGKSRSVCCGICKDIWFCRWCHGNRIKRIREIFKHRLSAECHYKIGEHEYWESRDGISSKELIIEFNKYEPCLACSKKLINKLIKPSLNTKFLDGNEDYTFHGNHWSGVKSGEKYSNDSRIRLEKVLNSFGFNKESFLFNPLDD